MSKKIQRAQLDIDLTNRTSPWGTVNGAYIKSTDSLEDAINKLVIALDRLAPQAPPLFSDASLEPSTQRFSPTCLVADGLAPSISAMCIAFASIIDFDVKAASADPDSLWDGREGTASFFLTGFLPASRVLSDASDVGIYDATDNVSRMQIVSDSPFLGFWDALKVKARIRFDLAGISHSQSLLTASLSHTKTGASTLAFHLEEPTLPSFASVSQSASMSGYVSGVPTLLSTDAVSVSFTLNNSVKHFYPADGVLAYVEGGDAQDAQYSWPGPASPTAFLSVSDSIDIYCKGSHTNNTSFTYSIVGVDATGGETSSFRIASNLRVDTLSIERAFLDSGARVLGSDVEDKSASSVYDHSQSLKSLGYTSQLMLLEGKYRYPFLLDYSPYLYSNVTPGPNYATGISETFRWASFKFSTVVSVASASELTITLSDSSGFTLANQLLDNCRIYYKLDHSGGETVWVEAKYFAQEPITASGGYIMVGYSGNMPNDLWSDATDGALLELPSDGVRRCIAGDAIPFGTNVDIYVRVAVRIGFSHSFEGISVLLN